MTAAWRMMLLSGFISVFIGILFVTSLLKTDTAAGLGIWGYLLLFWGIAAMIVSFRRLPLIWLMKVLAILGILLHGSLTFYWLLFPDSIDQQSDSGNILYAFANTLSVVLCMIILGTDSNKNKSHSISK